MSGMLETKIAASGRPDSSVSIAARKRVSNVLTGVIVDSEEVQASFAPIRMVTYWTFCRTALLAWLSRSATLAPLTA